MRKQAATIVLIIIVPLKTKKHDYYRKFLTVLQ